MGYHGFTDPYHLPAYEWNSLSPGSAAAIPPLEGFPVSIGGHTYMIDTSFEPYRREAFAHKSIPAQRQSLHFTNEPDDGTVSTEGLWRREMRDWSLGSGQTYLDRKGSEPNRFAHSRGVNPWNQWQLTLLDDVKNRHTATHGAVKAIRVGQYVYIIDGVGVSGGTVSFTKDYTAYTALAGTVTVTGSAPVIAGTYTFGGTPLDICTDGYNVYVLTTTGVWVFAQGSATPLAGNAGLFVIATTAATTAGAWTANLATLPSGATVGLTGIIAYIGGRLMMVLNNVASWISGSVVGANVFDLSSATPHVAGTGLPAGSPEHLYTHPSLTWKWTALAMSSQNIYMSGYNYDGVKADNGTVMRATINQTTANTTNNNTELNYPVQALPMTRGEYPTAMVGYLNYIFLGTNKGIRMCQALNLYDPTGNAGDLKAGPLLPTIIEPVSSPVTAIVGDGRYVYWAWNNAYDEYTGLGRLDLSTFIDDLAPAYASDIMVNGVGTVGWLDWDPVTDTPLMSMELTSLFSGGGPGNYIFTGDPSTCVSSGWVDSGLITYGIPDYKNAVKLDINIDNLVGTDNNSWVDFDMDADNVEYGTVVSYSNTTPKATLPFAEPNPQIYAEQYRITATLNAANSGVINTSPNMNRWCLKALPGIPSGIDIMVVILTYEETELEGAKIYMNPYAEYSYLEALRQAQTVVTYQEGPFTADVTVDLIHWLPERRRDVQVGGYHGDLIVTLKTVTG